MAASPEHDPGNHKPGLLDSLLVYIPQDRLQAMATGATLPDRTAGSSLFADISGFTPLTEALARDLGPQRGVEELAIYLNRVYDALIGELDQFGGSVIGFSGDAITCWFDGDSGVRAVACALAMQRSMSQFASVTIPSGKTVSLAMKAAVATGVARRFLVGDPGVQLIDVLAGAVLDRLAAAEHQASRGEVVLEPSAVAALGERVQVTEWRTDEAGLRFAVVSSLSEDVSKNPWLPLPADRVVVDQICPWLLLPVYTRLKSGQGEFLAELRPAVALFERFTGFDFDADPTAQARLDGYIRQVQSILERYQGTLIQLTIGDKGSYFYAAFGAPVAHEDDAVRAASAALELRALAQKQDYIHSVQIGISRGRMRTGAYGGTTRRTYGVLGDDTNLAARLMQAAASGQILVSKTARSATGESFSWQDLPAIKVKGKSEPVEIFSLLGVNLSHGIHFREPQYELPMVGRASELALAVERLDQSIQGQGQLIGIYAEAGMGKSRLLAEIIHRAGERGLTGYGGECQSYGTNTSYLVWQSIWRSFFGVDPAWDLEQQTSVLAGQLEAVDPILVPRLPLLGTALNLTIPDNDLTRTFDAKLRKASLESLLVDCLRARAREGPLLFVLEDCHWLDPLSHDLLEVIGRAIANLPVLLLLAYRPPELQHLQAPRVRKLPNYLEIPLTDFSADEARQLILLKLGQLFGSNTELSPTLLERVTARAQGNPFYIEELLNYLQDRGLDPQDRQALEQLDLPTSLQSLILTRIDQLTESQKTTLKVASVIGRLFKAAMLWGVYPQLGDYPRVVENLESLRQADLTPLDTPEPELTYIFKHVVTQEVAYESLLFNTRAVLHDHIGQYIEHAYADKLEQFIELLAFHYDHSQNQLKRIEYLLKAGDAALVNYANEAAINYYQHLLEFLAADRQVAVMLKLGQVFERVGQWAEADETYRKAMSLAGQLGDAHGEAQVQTTMGELLRKQGKYAEALEWQDKAWEGFEALGDQAGVAQTLHCSGTLAAQQGKYEEALTLYERSLAIRRELGDQPNIAKLLSNLGIIARYQGNYKLARSLNDESLDIRRAMGDRWQIAISLNNQGLVALDQDDYIEARSMLEEAIRLLREVGDRWYYANALGNLGNVARTQQDYPGARRLYRESLEINTELGDSWAIAYLLEDIGCLAVFEGQHERALQLVGAASALREKIGVPLPPSENDRLAQMLEPARLALDKEVQDSAMEQGRQMSLEQAIEYALQEAS